MFRKVRRWFRHRFSNEFSIVHARNFNPRLGASQGGEDGIIAEICRRLGIDRGWFVEFGAWDGVLYSNTYALLQRGWRGVEIECDESKFSDLQRTLAQFPGSIALCRRVGLEGNDRLDAILATTPLPVDFDLLSIDIDGNDYWVWESVKEYRPKIVVIEYNASFQSEECVTIPYDPDHRWDERSMYHGASAGALAKLGADKGYTLVAWTRHLNLFFVRQELAAGRLDAVSLARVPMGRTQASDRRAEFVNVQRAGGSDHRLLPGAVEEIAHAQFGRPSIKVALVQRVALHLHDAHHVAPLPLGDFAAQAEPLQLAENRVLGRGD
jgi:hypothetical protein